MASCLWRQFRHLRKLLSLATSAVRVLPLGVLLRLEAVVKTGFGYLALEMPTEAHRFSNPVVTWAVFREVEHRSKVVIEIFAQVLRRGKATLPRATTDFLSELCHLLAIFDDSPRIAWFGSACSPIRTRGSEETTAICRSQREQRSMKSFDASGVLRGGGGGSDSEGPACGAAPISKASAGPQPVERACWLRPASHAEMMKLSATSV